jgi:glutamate-1-semialdehyde 2,1-aminomutase
LFFTNEGRISNYQQATRCDIDAFKRFFHLMLQQGVYLAPSAYEAGFLSLAHSAEDLKETIAAADYAFSAL